MPNIPDLTLTTPDNVTLGAALFEPQTSNQRAVLISAAMGVKQSYYADFATYLTEQGFTVLTYDYRGIGRSKTETLKGYRASLLNWALDDQTTAINYLTTCYPSHKLLVVGHSFGGQIAGLTPEYKRVSGWLGVAAQSGYWRGWDGVLQLRMLLHSFADDDFAPPRSVEALRGLYPNAKSEHKTITPRDIGADAIGHFGYFRKQFKDSLWADAAAWLSAQ